jgi:RimJ/RimL family protein N-acetyltransferase
LINFLTGAMAAKGGGMQSLVRWSATGQVALRRVSDAGLYTRSTPRAGPASETLPETSRSRRRDEPRGSTQTVIQFEAAIRGCVSRGRLQHCRTGHDLPLPNRAGKTMLLSVCSEPAECRACGPRKRDGSEIDRNPQRPPARPARASLVTPATAAACGDERTILQVEPIDSTRHGAALYAAYATDREGRLWTYLPWGPYSGPEELCARIDAVRASGVRPEYALIDLASGKPFGQASYLNIDPAAGSIEVGGIVYAPAFQRGIAATEAMYLMMRRAFDELGYRRYAWQCNSLNARSRAAATRLGFTFEGVWRQANVHKGRNRDTAWFSILDSEWPAIKTAFERWLSPKNFDAEGRQRMRLSVLTAGAHRS